MSSFGDRSKTRVIVVMGVSGAGKTAAGTRLAERLGWPFVDADDEHPAVNRRKMASRVPLDDADRAPWLERLRRGIVRHLTAGTSAVLACSALKIAYRDALAGGDPRVVFVWLDVPRDVLLGRIDGRTGHWFPPALLESQLDTLEDPRDAVRIAADRPLDAVVDAVMADLAPHLPSS